MTQTLCLLLLLFAFIEADVIFRSSAQCKNHVGEDVDWWFILDTGPSKQYLYFDSTMARISDITGKPPKFIPLSNKYKLDDPETSPLLKTLYMSRPYSNLKEQMDNTVMIAVNDQRGEEMEDQEQAEKILARLKRRAKDPNAMFINMDKGKDIFGKCISSSNAHSKYVFTSQVAPMAKNQVKVRSYLISHSMPRFPNFMPSKRGSMKLPNVQRNVFSSNAFTAHAKAQHYFCQSFENEETLDNDGQLTYEPRKLEGYLRHARHIISVYHLFKTINAGVIFSNYYNQHHSESFKVYHKLFDPRTKWSKNGDLIDLVDGRNRLFPIGPVDHKLRRATCNTWDLHGAVDGDCMTSFGLRTTARQYQLNYHAIGHSGYTKLDVFDDLVAPQVLPKDLYSLARKPEFETKPIMDALIVQSWLDHTALGNLHRTLVDPKQDLAVSASVWITNVLSLRYPVHPDSQVNGEKYLRIQSFGNNHSKIAFSVPLHGTGKRVPLFCFADKNRTLSQRGRPEDKKGRGGAVWCTRSSVLSALMLSLHPATHSENVTENVPVTRLWKHFPQSCQGEDRMSVLSYDKEQVRFTMAVPSRYHPDSSYVCALKHPFVNQVDPGKVFRPSENLFAFTEAPGELSASSSDSDSASQADDESDSLPSIFSSDIMDGSAVQDENKKPDAISKRRRSSTPDPVDIKAKTIKSPLKAIQINRPQSTNALQDFSSPLKKVRTGSLTKAKYFGPVKPSLPSMTSPESYKLRAFISLSTVKLSEKIVAVLSTYVDPLVMSKLFHWIVREAPKMDVKVAKKSLDFSFDEIQ